MVSNIIEYIVLFEGIIVINKNIKDDAVFLGDIINDIIYDFKLIDYVNVLNYNIFIRWKEKILMKGNRFRIRKRLENCFNILHKDIGSFLYDRKIIIIRITPSCKGYHFTRFYNIDYKYQIIRLLAYNLQSDINTYILTCGVIYEYINNIRSKRVSKITGTPYLTYDMKECVYYHYYYWFRSFYILKELSNIITEIKNVICNRIMSLCYELTILSLSYLPSKKEESVL